SPTPRTSSASSRARSTASAPAAPSSSATSATSRCSRRSMPRSSSRERRQTRRRIETEQELVLAPGWFTRYARGLERPVTVSAEPRRGRLDNELTRFRYDVVLRADAAPPPPPAWRDWSSLGSVDAVAAAVAAADGALAVTGIPSARIAACLRAQEAVAAAPDEQTAGVLRAALPADATGIDPEELWQLPGGRMISLAWHGSGASGRYDLLAAPPGVEASLPPPPAVEPLANNPLRHGRARLAELRGWLQERLPEQMVPSAIVPIEAIPLTPNGKVDTSALPPADGPRPARDRSAAPATPAERRLAELWAEILGLEGVGVHDNFFELGGDSILTIKL